MEYIHIRNLEKYHPGYKDRSLQWGKIFINMVSGDPDTEQLDEIDWSRLLKLILLELRAQKPLPLKEDYLTTKGFNLKRRPMSLTLQMLHNFIDIVTDNEELRHVEKSREEKEEEKSRVAVTDNGLLPYHQFEKECLMKWNCLCDEKPVLSRIQEISEKRRLKLKKRFENKSFHALESIIIAIKEQSFLLGDNDRKWTVSFDWLIDNDTNYLKILEKKYRKDESNKKNVKIWPNHPKSCPECWGNGYISAQGSGVKIACREIYGQESKG